jgi:hypothetical protein
VFKARLPSSGQLATGYQERFGWRVARTDHHMRRNDLWEIDEQPRQANIAQHCVWDLANLVVVDQALEEMDDSGHGKSLPVCRE